MGAAGKTGRAVLDALSTRPPGVRPLVRRPVGLPAEVVVDMTDASSVRRAIADVDTLYHLAPNVHPDEVTIGRLVIDACRDVGVRTVVLHSVLHPQIEAMPHHWAKLRVEEALIESPLRWTILQPCAYQQNLVPVDGRLRVPYDIDAAFSLVHLDDVAEAAAVVLAEPGHEFATYELCGPEALSVREVARRLGAGAEAISVRAWRRDQGSSALGACALDALSAMFLHYDAHGLVGNPRALENLLGRRGRRVGDPS